MYTATRLRKKLEGIVEKMKSEEYFHESYECGFDRKLPNEKLRTDATVAIQNSKELYYLMARLLIFIEEIRFVRDDWGPVNRCIRCANAMFDKISVYMNHSLASARTNKINISPDLIERVKDTICILWYLRFAAKRLSISLNTFDFIFKMRL
jgi:hypothetical protein